VSNGYTSKCSEPYWSFKLFWHSSTLVLKTKRQSPRMSKKLKGWVKPVWRWTLWYRLIFCHNQKNVGLKGLKEHLGEFRQIYNLGALRDKYNLIRFWDSKGQKVKVMTRPNVAKKVRGACIDGSPSRSGLDCFIVLTFCCRSSLLLLSKNL